MKRDGLLRKILFGAIAVACLSFVSCGCNDVAFSNRNDLVINDSSYFETRGLNYFVFSNIYDATFDDSKISAVEIIHHGVRTATNGDVRMNPTPGQWDKLPKMVGRTVDRKNNRIEVKLSYPDYAFDYTLSMEARDGGMYFSVNTQKPIPSQLVGVAGLNLEFIPPVFWEHSYIADGRGGLFQRSPADYMTYINGELEPRPMATGKKIDVAPDEPMKHVTIKSTDGNDIMLFDGRNKQQNGNFVVRTLLPAGKSGKIVEWFITAETQNNWVRKPVVSYSQVGYHPGQKKLAVVELDKNDKPLSKMALYKVADDGSLSKVLSKSPVRWGMYTRYNYLQFDFSSVKEPGVYVLKYGDQTTAPFPIATYVYRKAWFPTLDVFFPVQMDHMCVREAYRIWHGAAHLDDALQAPVNRIHWDGWTQGPTTGNKYKSLEHIPGLNVGGWFDAGDFDIQTPSQQSVVREFARIWEDFELKHDQTSIDEETRYTEIHVPDGKPDVLQQLEHGVLQLVAQIKSIGYAIPGITESHLYQYRHLGDAVNKTDNKFYTPSLDSLQVVGNMSGTFDDRWAFTDRMPNLNYNTAISLAAASRALKSFNPELSKEALNTALFIWNDEHKGRKVYQSKNYGGGHFGRGNYIKTLECQAAFELWRTTGDDTYKHKMMEMMPKILEEFDMNANFIAQVVPFMDASFKQKVTPYVKKFAERLAEMERSNPFGVNITTHSWAGNGSVIMMANTAYLLHSSYPELIDKKYVLSALNYLYGCHPFHNLSFVSGVGAQPKNVAYGNNRADFTFIPGGVVPGVRILKPDFPENRDDYPFLWSENEYVINVCASYIYLVNAANELLKQS